MPKAYALGRMVSLTRLGHPHGSCFGKGLWNSGSQTSSTPNSGWDICDCVSDCGAAVVGKNEAPEFQALRQRAPEHLVLDTTTIGKSVLGGHETGIPCLPERHVPKQ